MGRFWRTLFEKTESKAPNRRIECHSKMANDPKIATGHPREKDEMTMKPNRCPAHLLALALCALTSSMVLADPITEQDRTHPLGWRDAPEATESTANKTSAVDCDEASYAKPEIHGAVSAGMATGSHTGTVTGESGIVTLQKRLGDCTSPGATSIGIAVGITRINGGPPR